jgi:hypothetical protein
MESGHRHAYDPRVAINRRPALGEGTVYFDEARGDWVGQASAGLNPVTGRRRRIKVRAPTKREAHHRLRARIEELERVAGTAVPATIGDLVERWLSRGAPKAMSARTLDVVRSMVTNHILPTLGAVKLGDVRVEHVEAPRRQGRAGPSAQLAGEAAQLSGSGVRRRGAAPPCRVEPGEGGGGPAGGTPAGGPGTQPGGGESATRYGRSRAPWGAGDGGADLGSASGGGVRTHLGSSRPR